MISRILVPLDGSDLALHILPYATNIARKFNSKMILFQAIQQPDFNTMPSVTAVNKEDSVQHLLQDRTANERLRALGYLEQIAKPLREQGIEIDCATSIGDAAKTIIEYAGQNEIDLIAIATHGQGGFKRLVFGSVADRILKNSGLPVLMVKPQQK